LVARAHGLRRNPQAVDSANRRCGWKTSVSGGFAFWEQAIRRITKPRRDWDGDFEGKRYMVRDLEYYECPACGEQVFDREATPKIEAGSPAFGPRANEAHSMTA
jgi:hypothetical protein